ncbi:MAG: PaaI family thioesterase [Bacteroidales bacterium]|nr:PaaI family thioesterase [Bacteroidales bacterium]MBR5781208.1 PaaI family thioesterase [Bacteroidales bacterium]
MEDIVKKMNDLNEGTMMETLGIEYLDVREGYVYARMFVKKELTQPYGMLHGGASMAFAESIGGVGSACYVDMEEYVIRGMQLSANHVKAAKVGTYVYATATIIHKGRQTHVWNIDVKNEDGDVVSTCRLTNFVFKKPAI